METKKLILIGLGILGVLLVIMWIRKRRSGWTKEHKQDLFNALMAKPVFRCPNSYMDVVKNVMKTLEKNYIYTEAMSLVNGETQTPDETNKFMDLLTPCLSDECMAEVLMADHKGMPMGCALCMVKKAMESTKGDRKSAGALLHDPTHLSESLKQCMAEGACNATPPTPKSTLGFNIVGEASLPGCC